MTSLPIEKQILYIPDQEEVSKVLENGLKQNFADVAVKWVESPDLTSKPFTLAAPGLCGRPCVIDLGGVPYLFPMVDRNRYYDLTDVTKLVDIHDGFILGAGAGPWKFAGVNSELMANLKSDGINGNRVARVSATGECDLITVPHDISHCAVLANLFCSEGKPGKVLEIKASRRTGSDNFVSCMRKALHNHYKHQQVGLGGAFLMKSGKARLHVMPDFSTSPIHTDAEVNNWLKFYEMSAPLIGLSVLVTHDTGLDLRLEHSHCFSHHGEGGHYHHDTTPDEVEYLAYYNIAETIYRIDRPTAPHDVGKC